MINDVEDPVVVVGGRRTAIGSFGGSLKDVEAHELGASCVRRVLRDTEVEAADVDEVVMGQVGQVGPDAYNARRVAMAAGLPTRVTAMNVNRLCSSGLQALITGTQDILTGGAQVVMAGGTENMSRQPFLDYEARNGWRLGDRRLVDGTLSLVTDPFGRYPMGVTAERVAERHGVSRQDQDSFAAGSQHKATAAVADQRFSAEITPVQRPRGVDAFTVDEHPRPGTTEASLAKLRPAFQENGTVTAGNSSGINDGAAALLLMRSSEARRRGLRGRLRLVAAAVTGVEPQFMGYAPARAIPLALKRAGMTLDDIDLIELNEAFAAQAVAVARDLDIQQDRLNVDGGAIALGHPVGATGAILTVKLLHQLERLDRTTGVVTMCIGGGQGMAAVFDRDLR